MKTQKGITLIALIITIIVMLILVGVSVTVALNTGLFSTAQGVAQNTQLAADAENKLSTGMITIRNATTGNLEQVHVNSFSGTTTENEGLDLGGAIGSQVAYSAGDITDWRILSKDETKGTVTLLGKAIIQDWNAFTSQQDLTNYVVEQYTNSEYEDIIESVSIISLTDIINPEGMSRT